MVTSKPSLFKPHNPNSAQRYQFKITWNETSVTKMKNIIYDSCHNRSNTWRDSFNDIGSSKHYGILSAKCVDTNLSLYQASSKHSVYQATTLANYMQTSNWTVGQSSCLLFNNNQRNCLVPTMRLQHIKPHQERQQVLTNSVKNACLLRPSSAENADSSIRDR